MVIFFDEETMTQSHFVKDFKIGKKRSRSIPHIAITTVAIIVIPTDQDSWCESDVKIRQIPNMMQFKI